MPERIDKITLKEVVPEVFPGMPVSTVWGNMVEFVRGRRYLVRSASGTGKSSLCSFIYGSRRVPEYRGEILFNGENIARFSHRRFIEIRRWNIAYLPQEMMLFGELTAMENILLKNRLTGDKTEQEIIEMMKTLGIDTLRDRPVRLLSVGQQQRVAVIRALCQPYDFILLDEPVSHLDPENNARVAGLIAADADSRGAAVIATSVGSDLLLEKPYMTLEL